MTKLTVGVGEDFPVAEKAEERRGNSACRRRRYHHRHHRHDLHERWHRWIHERFGRSQKKDAEH